MKYPSIEVKPAKNGYIVEKSWMEEEHNYQSEKFVYTSWQEVVDHFQNNPF